MTGRQHICSLTASGLTRRRKKKELQACSNRKHSNFSVGRCLELRDRFAHIKSGNSALPKNQESRRGQTPLRCLTTSAYSSTSPPAQPGRPSLSHPRIAGGPAALRAAAQPIAILYLAVMQRVGEFLESEWFFINYSIIPLSMPLRRESCTLWLNESLSSKSDPEHHSRQSGRNDQNVERNRSQHSRWILHCWRR